LKLVNKIETLTRPVANIKSANVLRKLLFGYVIFSFLQLLPVLENLYGDQSLIATQNLNGFTLTTLVNLLSVDAIKNYYPLFFIVQLLFAFIGLLGFFPRICTLFVFFATVNLQNRIYSTISGGDVLLCLLLFYLIFISDGKELKNKSLNEIQNAANRIFIALCKIQLIIIYSVSAIYKLQSPEWLNGSAIQQILLIDEYTLPILKHAVCSVPFLFKTITWAVLFYQVLFPFLVFVKRVKNYLLLTGIIFHLSIAFAMGLFNFSLILIFSYVIFYNFKRHNLEEAT